MTDFEKAVYEALEQIPRGKVSTYRALAKAIGHPLAVRAVGNALHKNPNAPRVPCHRVVYSDGRIGNYAKGPAEKIRLLKEEGVPIKENRIADFGTCLHLF